MSVILFDHCNEKFKLFLLLLVTPEVTKETPAVDPDQAIYGLSLPEWSKNSSMLPAIYKQVHKMCSSPSSNVISTEQLYPLLLSSDLPRDKLGHIWSKCNKAIPGELNEQELYLILGMVALAQVLLYYLKKNTLHVHYWYLERLDIFLHC